MQLRFFLLCFIVFLFLTSIAEKTSLADEVLSYHELMTLGKRALTNQDYDQAAFYFKLAYLVSPSSEDPKYYVHLIKRIKEGRTLPVDIPSIEDAPESDVEPSKSHQKQSSQPSKISTPKVPLLETKEKIKKASPSLLPDSLNNLNESSVPMSPRSETPSITAKVQPQNILKKDKDLTLDDELWKEHQNLTINLELGNAFFMVGKDIDRFLLIYPDVISVQRVDRDRLSISSLTRGQTFLHLWDKKGRWTFNINVVLPQEALVLAEPKDVTQEEEKPFRLTYSADWNSYYTGDSFETQKRRNLSFLQYTGVYGQTPYGAFDASAIFNKFEASTEVTGYGLGITDGKIGNFKDFSIRGFDSAQRFSPLTLPGKYFRGAMITAEAFNNQLSYTALWGLDQATFGFLAPGIISRNESYIEGAKVTLFPHEKHSYSVNFAQGYGVPRPVFLKKRAYSLQTKHQLDPLLLDTELAHDEDNFAGNINTTFGNQEHQWKVNFRDIHKDFVTATNFPADRGEVGSTILWHVRQEKYSLNSALDIFQDNFLPNPDHPNDLNFDFNSSLDWTIDNTSGFFTSLFFVDTPGVISPRKSFRISPNYSKQIPIWSKRYMGLSSGLTYQRSRFESSPSSDFDRYSVHAGFRLPFFRNFSYFLNYEYSWVDDNLTSIFNPHVLTTGFNYGLELRNDLSTTLGFSYRDEEQTEMLHSFLAGEDSITGNIGVSFHPKPDFEIFADGRMRNIWSENIERPAYNEADIRLGVRSAWDLPLSWSPKGVIKGRVYKDINGNNAYDLDEPGVANIKVNVGRQSILTDQDGYYQTKIRAKKVLVGVDVDSVPEGFLISSALIEGVEIKDNEIKTFNFGLTSHSGIYGVVFIDQNQNLKQDPHEPGFARVKIILNQTQHVLSDFQGGYFFNDLKAGQHSIFIDVNSLPSEYIPAIKLKHNILLKEGTTHILNVPLKEIKDKD